MADYTYVIDSSFKPFSMQEMLVPFTAYKEAFEKAEEKYDALSEKADKFKYLSEKLPEGSKARDIYEGYAKDLKSRAEDFAQNGLTMNNGRALTSLKRRYSGEIGRLVKADEAMEEEKKLRRSLNAQDSSRLYAMDNLNIDDFLDGRSPNLYSVSGNELYTRGAAAGKAASARVYNVNGTQKTLGGYYLDFAQSVGYDPDKMRAFAENAANIPELAMMADNILKERGVLENLSGYNLQRARQSVINGMIDGAVYSESHNPQRDLGVLTQAEKVNDVRARQAQAITMWQNGAKWDSNGNVVGDTDNLNYQAKKIANEAAQAQLDVMYPMGEDQKRHLNPAYAKEYSLSPNGKWQKEPTTKKEAVSLSKLGVSDLAQPGGFTATAKDGTTHYSYKGGAVNKDNKYIAGAIGKDVDDTWGTWGIGNSPIVTNMALGLFGGGDFKVPTP